MTDDDPYLWLEEITDERALGWVRARNEETEGAVAGGAGFAALRDRLRDALDSEVRIPYVRRHGDHLYNLWQDAEHPRGLWRRTTLEEYRAEAPGWQVVLDLDALAREEEENWVWKGASVLRPGHRLALVHLSRGGADAVEVREFDLEECRFVKDGFTLPEAKSEVGWIDADHLWVGTDFGPGTLTASGYARQVRRWLRGTPLSEAVTAFEAAADDVLVYAYHDPTPGFERDFVHRYVHRYHTDLYLWTAEGGPTRLDLPEDALASVHREWLVVRTRTPWTTGGREYPAGALLAVDFEAFLAGRRELTEVFTPDAHTSLDGYAWTRDHLLLTLLHDVSTELRLMTPAADGSWHASPLPALDPLTTAEVLDVGEDDNEFWTVTSGFTTPATVSRGVAGRPSGADAAGGPVVTSEVLKREPEFFAADGIAVEQHFATSDDGTRIPYFVVGPRGAQGGPTMLTGYGGFELARKPAYSPVIGRGWLERGGTYVLANIRGGGEYGPEWHRAALKYQRHKAYEDFAAVAADLVRRGTTTPSRLAVQGASNGGLLACVMLTRYPHLFGAVAAQVPLTDMRRYHRMLAGASWVGEYGDPDLPEDWAYLSTYSPYHNVSRGGGYPPVLLTASTRDDRVHPGHARKMAELLRERGHDVLYHENIEGGHAGAADNAQIAFKWALILDFLWTRVNAGAPQG
jgi:prolyl oligopeptidase